ncbi:MAG TPA: AAA family ATPase, partial [Acidimicrobiales bacterium]|nr:AAA family ATPase [Acidimicrobiales bacterium]
RASVPAGPASVAGTNGSIAASTPEADDRELVLGGPGALLAALEGVRTGFMRDIVSTIQREQDEIIRAPLPGVLVVQGGPGTGKTAVALHRAAYLLYTHRFPLERQGVLVIGPNPLFLRYIEHVLPSLGESGVTLSTIAGVVHGVQARAEEAPALARLKGEARMAKVVARAVRSRQRPLRHEVALPYGASILRLTTEMSAEAITTARRRPGTHNARRRFVERLVVRQLADEYQRATRVQRGAPVPSAGERPPPAAGLDSPAALEPDGTGGPGPAGSNGIGLGPGGSPPEEAPFDLAQFSRQIRLLPALSEALDRMWPRLSAEELLHDLFGSPPLLALAAGRTLGPAEQAMLRRPRSTALADIPWTVADLALIDEARVLLGRRRSGSPGSEADEGPRTYGQIVVDEAQDLSPMQLRMVARRSLSGAVTVVGDIGQATGPWAPSSWDEVTAHLPGERPPRVTELTVGYRTPAEVVDVAAPVLAAAAPGLRPPRPVRHSGHPPSLRATTASSLADCVVEAARELVAAVTPGTAAVLAPTSLVGELVLALDEAGFRAVDPRRDGLGSPLSLLPVDLANGLEFDAVVVVEPSTIAQESPQGLRALYVALTRPTQRLVVVHARPLPPSLAR